MPDNKKLEITAQERSEAVQEIARLQSQTQFLSELLKRGQCGADEAKCHMTLVRQVHDNLAGLLHVDALSEDLQDAYRSCREANARAHALETQLGRETGSKAAMARLKQCEEWFQAWYKLVGFDYVHLDWGPWGLNFKTSDNVEHPSDDPENISFGDRELAVMVAPLVPYEFLGYDLKKDTFHDSLLDTQANHGRLEALFARTFPGSRIHSFSSHLDGQDRLLRAEGHVPWEDVEAWRNAVLAEAARLDRPAGRFYVEKADLASRLASKTYTSHGDKDQIKEDRTRLAWLRMVTDLWDRASAIVRNAGDGPVGAFRLEYRLPDWAEPLAYDFPEGMTKERLGEWFAESFKLDWKADLDAGTLRPEEEKPVAGIPAAGEDETLADRVLELYNNTPDGEMHDADTVLKDIMDEADFEETGLGPELINIWKNSSDRAAVEAMFHSMTGWTFRSYLDKCGEETTR